MNIYSTTNIDDGNWHFIAGRYDGSNLSIWVDGVQERSAAYAGLTLSSNAASVQIGGDCNCFGASGYIWDGVIDDVRAYNYALSNADIAGLYASGTSCVSSGSCSTAGQVRYNSSVLEYCTGVRWLPLAP